MFTYKVVFLFHIFFRKIFKLDLRPHFIKFTYTLHYYKSTPLKEKPAKNLFIQKLKKAFSNYKEDGDKRLLWEFHRLDFINDNKIPFENRLKDLITWMDQLKNFNLIIFENMMECSIRASNIIIFFQNNINKFSKKETLFIKKHIKRTHYLNYLAPDMYIKRSGIIFRDESNNHFIFCLFFQLLYFYQKRIQLNNKLDKYLKYINLKFSDDGYLKEGSSFYSYSVANAVLKILFLIRKETDIKKYNFIFKAVCSAEDMELDLKNINFGDKDGTIILPFLDLDEDFINYASNTTSGHKYDLKDNIALMKQNDLKIIINMRKVYNYGTLGHYHDDYGHFNLYTDNQPIIVDPGTLSYSSSKKRFDTSSFHNALSIEDSKSMTLIRNFEKLFHNKNKSTISDNSIILKKENSVGTATRKFFLDSFSIVDEFNYKDDAKIHIFFTSEPMIKDDQKNIISLIFNNLIIKISCNDLFNYNIEPSLIAKNYSEPTNAYLLVMNFKKLVNYKLKWEIKCLN
tara:strand:- start:354 stop:1892 length:1539 start_codon:yes stop_codon:yes gene_type:complete